MSQSPKSPRSIPLIAAPSEDGLSSGTQTDPRRLVHVVPTGPRCKRFGISLQCSFFSLNMLLWVFAVLQIVYGVTSCWRTSTLFFDEHVELLDLRLLTPVTFLLYYGGLLFLVTSVGCLASTRPKWWLVLTYILLIGGFIAADYGIGIRYLIDTNALTTFRSRMESAIEDVRGREDDPASLPVGFSFIGLRPFAYWSHLQRRGRCCGMNDYRDWGNSTLGMADKSVPDSCCTPRFIYDYCGWFVLKHDHDINNTEEHSVIDLVYNRGCKEIFPKLVMDHFYMTNYSGLVILTVLLYCAIVCVTIVLIVTCKCYRIGDFPGPGKIIQGFFETLCCVCRSGCCRRRREIETVVRWRQSVEQLEDEEESTTYQTQSGPTSAESWTSDPMESPKRKKVSFGRNQIHPL